MLTMANGSQSSLLSPMNPFQQTDPHPHPPRHLPMTMKDATLQRLAERLNSRKQSDPEQSSVAHLFYRGEDAILKKIGEEATEVVMAAKDLHRNGEPAALIGEVADLWFHFLIMLAHYNLGPDEVIAELIRREG